MSKYYFTRLEYLNQLIKKKSTGSPLELAQKMNVSERTTFYYLDTLKSLGADVKFSRTRNSYYYFVDGTFDFQFKKSDTV
jgi:predicted DNA-binding transcriptional regulator YafY